MLLYFIFLGYEQLMVNVSGDVITASYIVTVCWVFNAVFLSATKKIIEIYVSI